MHDPIRAPLNVDEVFMRLINRQCRVLQALASRRGFTLTELLVVIGIIIALVALLIPALAHVRRKGRDAEARAQLQGIAEALETYHSTFGAYPGPAAQPYTSSGNPQKVLSGSQNMLLGLSFALYPPGFTLLDPVPVPTGGFADPTIPQGPINYGVTGPTGASPQLKPFYSVTAKNISSPLPGTKPPAWPPGGFGGVDTNVNNFKFPVPIDTYPDALPILYYRRSPGVTVPVAGADTTFTSAYCLRDNEEYTKAKLVTAQGNVYDQTVTNPAGWNPTDKTLRVKDLEDFASDGGLPARARGGFILVSAGADRLYGSSGKEIQVPPPGKSPPLPTDNIVVVGGN